MAPELSAAVRQLLEAPNLAHFVTLMPNGAPQVTPLWVDHDGTHVLVNTAAGRQKALNVERDPRVALTVVDRENLYRYVQIRGRVVEITPEGAFEHIRKLAGKYTGRADFRGNPDEQRLIIKVLPEHIQEWNLQGR